MNTDKITTQLQKLEHSRVAITVTIPQSEIELFRKPVLQSLQETIEIDGFRKGHAPEVKIIERVGEMGILAEMADRALSESYPTIITKTEIIPIGRPEIAITKMAPGNDVEYVITTDVLPTITLTDVKKIASEKNKTAIEISVSDEDVEKAIKEIKQMRAHQKMHDDGIEHHDHNHQNIADQDLEPLTDEYVKGLGDFTDVADFTKKLKENMIKEKEAHANEKQRIEIIEAIVASGTFDIPKSLVDFELDKMMEQFSYDLAMSGMKLEEYARHNNKTIDELKSEYRGNAEQRVKIQLALEKIAQEFSIKTDPEKIEAETEKLMEMYKNENINKEGVTSYVTQIMTNTAVFDWLGAQK